MSVRIGDVQIATAIALSGWAGFYGSAERAAVMGDLIVTASELEPVQAEFARQDFQLLAVHNHLVGEEPQVTYLHFFGEGKATDLARRLDRVVALTAAPRPVRPAAPGPVIIDSATVFRVLGQRGRAQGNVAQLSFMLVEGSVAMGEHPVPSALILGSPVNIQAVTAERAVATGDFTITARQVQPVTQALVEHGIAITALHSHLVGETPSLYFMHFWADDRLDRLLSGLRAAVDAARAP